MPRPYIGVVGTSDPADTRAGEVAAEVGGLLAARGAVVVCGGLGGVMEWVCQAAQAAGGMTVGLLPGASREGANAFLTVALPTGLGEMRNGLIVRASDAVIAIGGGWGTLSEIALAARNGVPVIGLATWSVSPPGSEEQAGFTMVDSARAAVDLALR